jgi:hypothetical protein
VPDAASTVKYHGVPITPNRVLERLGGYDFCVSFVSPSQVGLCHELGRVMLDNGAFTMWRQGKATDWPGYYSWCERWLDAPTTWAVIPDVIDGTGEENDALVREWPHGDRGAPVWHLHEPIERLLRLCDDWPRVCFGSSGAYAVVGSTSWHHRVEQAFNALAPTGSVPVRLHMLRGMSLLGGPYPFDSVDSADIGRNHWRPGNEALRMARRWARMHCPPHWTPRSQLTLDPVMEVP